METEPRRGAFRLKELLAVCAIGLVLLALLLPAIRTGRESTRRDQCSNKLKQIGLALQNHHDVIKRFPALSNQGQMDGSANVWNTAPGATFAPNSPAPNGYTQTPTSAAGYSWIVMILPYMEERPIYNSIFQASKAFSYEAFSSNGFSATLQGPPYHYSTIALDEVLCPSYGGDFISTASSGKASPPLTIKAYAQFFEPASTAGHNRGVTITNYVALSATHLACMALGPNDLKAGVEPPNGTIVPGIGLNLKAVIDGRSKTVIVCETKEPAVNSWYDGTVCWTVGANPNASNPPTTNSSGFWSFPPGTTNATGLNYGPGADGTPLFAPNGTTAAQTRPVSWGPSSDHAGGVVMHLACDGAVHAITSDVDPSVYLQLITRAGREPVTEPDVCDTNDRLSPILVYGEADFHEAAIR